MSDNHIQPAPRAPQPTAISAPAPSPSPAPTAPASQSNTVSPPTTANAPAPSTPTPDSAAENPAAGAVALPVPTATEEEPQTLNARLNNADRYWKFKGALQAALIILGLIGIGTIGWVVTTIPEEGFMYGYDTFWFLWPCLVTFSVSVAWCLVCIIVLVVRKRPVHPGARVAMDLLLWLGFIITALFVTGALIELMTWGEDGRLQYGYSSSYQYRLANNGTWVWRDPYDNYSRECNRTYSYSYRMTCAEQDAYVNQLWQEKPHRQSVETAGVVCQYFGLVLHFALFVWACIDCHYHNRNKVSKDAEKIAANIVQTMISNGAVIPPPGQAHMRPVAPWGHQQVGYYQLPTQNLQQQQQQPQAYPMVAMYPQQMMLGQQGPQQFTPPQGRMGPANGPATGPVNEKSAGMRYA